jgi:hypothetical protein
MGSFVPPALQNAQNLTRNAVYLHNPVQEAGVQLEFGFVRELQPCSWHVVGDGTYHRVSSCVVLGCGGR